MFQITLRVVRESCGYTVEEVAEYCGIALDKMKEVEDDPGAMKDSIAIKLRKLFGIPIDYIRI
jgi:DNA-binding XRE family transcriptional regulator